MSGLPPPPGPDGQPPSGAAVPPANPMIRLVDVHMSFGPLRVLRGVSLDLYHGQAAVIVGPSGTGKSVLLKIIVGLIKPDRGQVFFENKRIDRLGEAELVEVRKKIGMLFQMGALFDSMNVEKNICFPLVQHTDMTADQMRQRCARALRLVGLEGIESKMPSELSGGQRKRVALARAVVLEPSIVLYDEPTTGLDPIRSDVINELISSLCKRLGITTVVVTHDMASANKIADRMIMLYDGRVIADSDPKTFYQTDQELVQRFIHGRANPSELESIHRGFEPLGV